MWWSPQASESADPSPSPGSPSAPPRPVGEGADLVGQEHLKGLGEARLARPVPIANHGESPGPPTGSRSWPARPARDSGHRGVQRRGPSRGRRELREERGLAAAPRARPPGRLSDEDGVRRSEGDRAHHGQGRPVASPSRPKRPAARVSGKREVLDVGGLHHVCTTTEGLRGLRTVTKGQVKTGSDQQVPVKAQVAGSARAVLIMLRSEVRFFLAPRKSPVHGLCFAARRWPGSAAPFC
jgi:hypothetical protein